MLFAGARIQAVNLEIIRLLEAAFRFKSWLWAELECSLASRALQREQVFLAPEALRAMFIVGATTLKANLETARQAQFLFRYWSLVLAAQVRCRISARFLRHLAGITC